MIELVDKLVGIVCTMVEDPVYKTLIKDDLLSASAMIRQNNFKVGSKAISSILHKRFNISKDEELNYDDDYKARKSAEM